jgi:NAD(P)-dependent dehydrogenase (short-subunit alcohol dehydrogenase family)
VNAAASASSKGLLAVPMSLVAKGIDKVAHPPRVSDPDRLRAAASGKTVLVTGASYGLGEATARRLGAAGATVLLVARSADKLDELAASIGAAGGRAVAYPADLADEDAVSGLAKRIAEDHGAVDVVVSNAGKSIRRSLHLQYDRPHDFDRTIGTNYLGPIRLLLGLLPAMRERGSGHIVNISSLGVRFPPGPRWGAYLASKGAFDMWLRSVTPELHADGVHVTSVYMGLIHTRMSAPTPSLRNLPGLSADQAADIVAKAIIERPRTIEPRWALPGALVSGMLPGPFDRLTRLWYRYSADSTDSHGEQ